MRAKPRRKMRKTTRMIYLGISLVLVVGSTISLLTALFLEDTKSITKEIYSYGTNFNLNYDVYLKENEFIENKKLQMGQVYVTDLIDYLDLQVQFQYKGSQTSDISYKYNIKGILEGSYSKDRYSAESMGERICTT